MLPYKVRKPAWGSLKPKSAEGRDVATARLRLGGDPVDPHAVGGNLQRAILLDLIGLRERHRDAEAKAAAAAEASAAAFDRNVDGTAAAIDPRGGGAGSRHAPPGSSFARFKACFRDARFGAMHTRTIPPRVDRGEYVQLLYSSCFHLLEGAFRRSSSSRRDEDDPEPPSWTEDPSRAAGSAAFDATFAAFALYALRRTNVLPEAPPPRSRTPRTEAGRLDERSLEEAWSMLPVGVSGEEDRLHRRTFRSGVRVDRRNYLLLLRLRGVCRARVARCGADETEAAAAEASASWKCFCGLAADAVRVIDRMIFDDGFFQYCEYHGPHSVEGLAGSPNFYRAYLSKEAIEKKSKQPKKCTAAAPTSKSSLALSAFELNAMGGPHYSLDTQNLPILVQNHRSNLSSVMGQLQKSRQYGSDLQPKQRELVDATLQGIMQPTTSYLQIAKELSGTNLFANPNDEPSPRAQVKQAMPEPEVQPTESKWDLPTFPDSFSSALCDQIRCSLLDFKDEAEKIRKAVMMESIAAVKTEQTRAFDPELGSFDGLDSSVAQEKSLPSAIPIGGDAAAAISNQSKRNRREKERGRFLEQDVLGDDDMTDKLEKKEDTSVATGAGKNALLTLLSMAEGDESIRDYEPDDEVSLATGVGKNALLSLLSMAERSDPEILDGSGSSDSGDSYSAKSSSIHDGASVESGKGKKALQHLLAQSLATRGREREEGGNRAGQHKVVPQKQTRKTTAKRKAPAKHANPKSSKKKRTKRLREECSVSEMEDEFSLATGRGRNALSSLLAMAGERNSGPLGDESLSSCSDNSFVDDGDASTRFADVSADTRGRAKSAIAQKVKRETLRRIPPQATGRSTSAEGPERKSFASTELPPLERSDYLEEHDEEFMNASAATGFASEDSFSVDTGDGKKALASLLAAVKRVEQV